MTREEMHDFVLGVALIALGYAFYQHHKATSAPPPNQNTGIVPPGYDPSTHDYLTGSLDDLLQGAVAGSLNTAIA
jgi:hypothetical protein